MTDYDEELKKFRKAVWDLIKKTLKGNGNGTLDVSDLMNELLTVHLEFTAVSRIE